MEKNYITKNKLIKEDDVKKMLKSQSFEGNTEMVYILPEVTGEKDLINEFSPNLYKVAKANNIPCTIIYSENDYEYLSLRDSEILLPFIISLSAGACYDLLKYFITRFFIEKKDLKVRLITKKEKETEYREIEMEGDAEGVIKALEILKESENNEV